MIPLILKASILQMHSDYPNIDGHDNHGMKELVADRDMRVTGNASGILSISYYLVCMVVI